MSVFCVSSALTRPLWSFYRMFEHVGFLVLNLAFHGRVGPRRICRLSSDILMVVYVYIYTCVVQLTLAMQVAVVCCFCVCSGCFICSGSDLN